MKMLATILLALGLSLSTFAQTNEVAETKSVKAANAAKALINGLTERVEVGGTYAAWFDEEWNVEFSPALTLMGVVWKKDLNERFQITSGVCYNYLTKPDKHAVGLGASIAVFSLPKAIETARDSVPVVNIVTPKLLKLKVFAEVGVDLDQLGQPRPVLVGGVTLPF